MYLGVDGCKAGWLSLSLVSEEDWQWDIHASFPALWDQIAIPKRLLIDIPIGLPYQQRRSCDTAARAVLTRRRSSSVFPIPARAAMQAPTYLEGCNINQQILGVKISKQTWNIRQKILEVDQWLQVHPSHTQGVLECHPEVAFWSWNHQQPMLHSKKTQEGQAERLALLEHHMSTAREMFSAAYTAFPRKYVLADDILDTMILAISAQAKNLQTLPKTPELDQTGLPMQIVYPSF